MNPLQHIKSAHTRFDFHLSLALPSKNIKPTCSKGCFYCCAEPLYVLTDEAKLAIKSIPPQELEGVKERTKQWAERAEKAGVLKVESPHVFAYRQAGLMCPLMKDGVCLIYKHRPLGCRSHMAVGEAKLCADDHTRLQQKYVTALEPMAWCRNDMIRLSKQPCLGDHLGVFLARHFFGPDICPSALPPSILEETLIF